MDENRYFCYYQSMTEKIKNLQKKIIPVLKKYGVKRASVFGSFARGEEKNDSDIDILVKMPEDASLLDMAALKISLEKKIAREIDVMTYRSVNKLVKKYFNKANENETALLMEFVLHGLASYSLISKKVIEGRIEFKDLMGSMMNLGNISLGEDDDLNDDDFR